MVKNYSSLTLTEFGCIITLSILTIISAVFMFEADKNHNSPLINSLFMKSAGAIALLCVGIFLFEESYKIHQIVGIGLILFGVYLVSSNKMQFL
jgi:multidrug transporter EmrE-like cation transporter